MSVICRKVGNSITTTIPQEIVKSLGIQPGDKLNITEDGNSIVIIPAKKRLKGEVFLEEYYQKPLAEIEPLETEIVDWGNPQGEEIW